MAIQSFGMGFGQQPQQLSSDGNECEVNTEQL